jgi:hypothetical protein
MDAGMTEYLYLVFRLLALALCGLSGCFEGGIGGRTSGDHGTPLCSGGGCALLINLFLERRRNLGYFLFTAELVLHPADDDFRGEVA